MQIQHFNISRQNPKTYTQRFATENNISLSEAKEQLKAKYSGPSQGSMMKIFISQLLHCFCF